MAVINFIWHVIFDCKGETGRKWNITSIVTGVPFRFISNVLLQTS